jgi:hypothetical protein
MSFEKVLAYVASQCEYNYGAMGRAGYLYESVKDQLKWAGMTVKNHIRTVMRIGDLMSMNDEDYKDASKENLPAAGMSGKELEDYIFSKF